MSLRKNNPFTMVELIVAMSLFVLIAGVCMRMIHNTQLIWRDSAEKSDVYQQARLTLSVISRDLLSLYVSESGDVATFAVEDFSDSNNDLPGSGSLTYPVGTFDKAAFIFAGVTASNVGRKSDSAIQEFAYEYYGKHTAGNDTDKQFTLWRRRTSPASGSNYDFHANPREVAVWASSHEDTHKLASGVYSITINAYDSSDNLVASTDSDVLPNYFKIELVMGAENRLSNWDQLSEIEQFRALDSFVKFVYLKRGL